VCGPEKRSDSMLELTAIVRFSSAFAVVTEPEDEEPGCIASHRQSSPDCQGGMD
jgi:hypothetical protein